jgi:RNA polymerase sigma-70 factor (ECF subfamily)
MDTRHVYEAHGRFVWDSLQRLGIRSVDLSDVFQETFMIVHQRLGSFEGQARLTTWLFGVCLRVAANYRRRAHLRREEIMAEVPGVAAPEGSDPESAAERAEARRTLQHALDAMDLDKRAIFVMFEVEELSCAEIAAALGIPVGTVYSRLHHARRQFDAALAADERSGGTR